VEHTGDRAAPPEKDRYTFRIGDVFPPGDEIAMFMVSLTAALNDLLYANWLLVPEEKNALRREPTPEEHVYLIRLVAGHVWETLLLFRNVSELPVIKAFLDGLIEPARPLYAQIMAAATDKNNETFKTLAHVRNKSWHYPRPDGRELHRAVAAVAADEGALEMGETMPTIRGRFADDVFVKMLTRFSGDDREALGLIFSQLAQIVVAIIHLAQYALDDYLGRIHAASVTRESRRP